MITHAFDVAVVNSWLNYRDNEYKGTQPQKFMDLLQFKMNVAEVLVRSGKPQGKKKRGRPSNCNAASTSQTPQDEAGPKRGPREWRPVLEVQKIWLTTWQITMQIKKQQNANWKVVLGKHTSSVISARCNTALCHKAIVSKMHTENE